MSSSSAMMMGAEALSKTWPSYGSNGQSLASYLAGFEPRPTHVESAVERVTVGQVFFSSMSIYSVTFRRCFILTIMHLLVPAFVSLFPIYHTIRNVRTYPPHYTASHKTVIFTVASGKNLKFHHVLVVVVNDAARIGDCKA